MKKKKIFQKEKKGQGGLKILFSIPLSILSGVFVFLSFPNFNLFYLQWVSFVPLLFAIRWTGAVGAFFIGLLSGFVTNAGGFYWVVGLLQEFGHMKIEPSMALSALLCLYQGLTFAFPCYFIKKLEIKGIPFIISMPFIFTAVEYLLPFIFPWYIGNGQSKFLQIIQIVDITGISGLSFLIFLVNANFYQIISNLLQKKRIPIFSTSIVFVLFISTFIYGLFKIFEINEKIRREKKLKIGVVEANVGIWEKEAKKPSGEPLPPYEQVQLLYYNLLKHQFASMDVEKKGAELIVWPESSYIPVSDIYVKTQNFFWAALDDEGNIYFRDEKKWDFDHKKNLNFSIKAMAGGGKEEIVLCGEKGKVYFNRNGEWKEEFVGIDKTLRSIFISPMEDGGVIVAGDEGFVAMKDNNTWKLLQSGIVENINSIFGRDIKNLYFIADGGIVLRFNGKEFKQISIPDGVKLHSGDFENDKSVWFAGSDGHIFNIRNGKIISIPTSTHLSLFDIYARRDGIYAVGEGGLILKFMGEGFVQIDNPSKETLRIIEGNGNGEFLIGGDNGTLMEYDGKEFKIIKTPSNRKIVSLSYIDFFPSYPIPRDVKFLYVSDAPLPLTRKFPDSVLKDRGTDMRDRNAALRGFSKPLLFGAVTFDLKDGKRNYYNTAILTGENGKVLGGYDKNYLLIFGEYMPFGDIFPFLHKIFPESGNFTPGEELKVFDFRGIKIGIMICYEDILPRWTRKLSGKNPNLLINLTNDAWFGKTSEPYLHLALSVFRSVENRLFLIRSTNTGVSAVIDPAGRVLKKTSIYDPETLLADITPLSIDTIYRKFGDIFAYFTIAVSVLMIFVAFFEGKKGK